ncbi:hypothetical protein CRENBAI_006050 [Crenichthys baileyi]|uniref:Uncharacterized protein n=1 Tax=Crenichthys baileyi TaxID=28760 RepID=A0AAV9SDT5_9TELE
MRSVVFFRDPVHEWCQDKEDEEYEPPARQLRSASRPIKRKEVSVPRKKEQLIQANKERWAGQATSRPGDDNEDKWHSPVEPDIEA